MVRPCRASVAVFTIGRPSGIAAILCYDERQSTLGILPLVQVSGRLGQHHLQRRPNIRFHQMAAHCDAVVAADDDV